MKILFLGDIVGKKTVAHLENRLWALRKELRADMVIANGENATDILGLSAEDADRLLAAGVDVLTGGNHTFHDYTLYPKLEDDPRLLRPLNYVAEAPGTGEGIYDVNGTRVLVLNLFGARGMDACGSPFEAADRALRRNEGKYDLCVVDIHAEATAEKQALGYHLCGRASAVVGTHTHVATADACILLHQTAYITDLGMCGPEGGILGTDRAVILKRFLTGTPQKFKPADGEIVLRGALVELSGKNAVSITQITE